MANLLEKASILITPTAYGDGKIHSAKPVQSLSAEKITIGNDTSDIVGLSDNQNINIQTSFLTIGKTYKIDFEIYDYVQGSIFLLRPNDLSVGSSVSANGKYTYTVVADASTSLIFRTDGLSTTLKLKGISVKEVIDSDLNFTRGSAATRVNAQGLVENVDTLGSELVTNGDFATDSDWNKPSNLSISNGKAFANNVSSGQQLWQSFNSIGTYKIDFTISNYVIGEIRPIFHGGTHLGGENVSENGIFTQYLTATSAPSRFSFKFFGSSSIMCIDNVSVKEVIDVTNIPRINYKDGVGSWLIEPQSTNRITQSQVFSGYGSTTVVVADGAIISPDGALNGASVTDNNDGGNSFSNQIIKTQAVDVLSTYTWSIFAKKKGNDYIVLRTSAFTTPSYVNSFFDLNLGTVLNQGTGHTSEIENYGNGWYRCSITFTTDAVDTSGTLQMRLSENGTNTELTRDGTNSIYTWGWQFEKQSFATSYIPTAATVQTRLSETASRSGLGDLIDSTQGVFYADISALANENSQRVISISDGTHNNTVKLGILNHSTQLKLFAEVRSSGVTQCFLGYNFGAVEPTFKKCAIKFKENNFALWIDGVEKLTDTSGSTFSINTLNSFGFNRGQDGSQIFEGDIKAVAVFPILTDEELECLTTR